MGVGCYVNRALWTSANRNNVRVQRITTFRACPKDKSEEYWELSCDAPDSSFSKVGKSKLRFELQRTHLKCQPFQFPKQLNTQHDSMLSAYLILNTLLLNGCQVTIKFLNCIERFAASTTTALHKQRTYFPCGR